MDKISSPLFSIITPVLNNKDGLLETIKSIKSYLEIRPKLIENTSNYEKINIYFKFNFYSIIIF